MAAKRNLKLDLAALGLLGLVVFLGASLVTYSTADPVPELLRPFNQLYQQDILVYPQATVATNACGKWGALAADLMLTVLGVGAYFAVVSLAVVDVLLLLRREIDTPWMRAIGWALSLVGLTVLARFLLPSYSPGPIIGAGGYLGAWGQSLLEAHFAFAGSLILSASLLVGGLMLCTDYALFRFVWSATSWTAKGIAKGSSRLAVVPRRTRRSDIDLVEIEEDTEDEIVGADEDEWDEDEDEDEVTEPLAHPELPVRVRAKDKESSAAVVSNPEESITELTDADPSSADLVVKQRETKTPTGVASRPHFAVKRKLDRHDREEVMSKLDQASVDSPKEREYELPDINLLIAGEDFCFDEQEKEVRRKAKILEKTFANFGFNVKVVEIETGPVIAQYEVELEAGLRLSKITGLADDLAIALRVPSVRIVAPLPGKNTVGIEVPNEVRQIVRLREVIEETNGKIRKMNIPLFLGKDVSGKPLTVDLASLPHLLIAGRTGTGKSVCLNAIISSILMTKRPDEVRMLMIDPKMVELSGYGRLPHLMHPVVTDMRKAEAILAWAVEKMEERYALLARTGVRHINSYNQLGDEELRRRFRPESEEEWGQIPNHLPFIVIVADEMADLMMTSGKEVEQHIIRLAQKSRAVGIHLILATQKPTVDVITGLIKSNLPARISFQVASRTDSRVVLDEMGADKLLGNGDMLFLWPGTSTLLRGQGTYLSDEEIERVVNNVSTGEQNFVHELVNLKVEDPQAEEARGPLKKRDDLYEAAVDIVVREGRGSVSLLQRALGIGYGRAARLIDFMAEDGIVGTYAGSQAREVLISLADWELMQNGDGVPLPEANASSASLSPTKRRSNRIVPEPAWQEDEEATRAETDWEDDGLDDNASDDFIAGVRTEDFENDEFEDYEAESA